MDSSAAHGGRWLLLALICLSAATAVHGSLMAIDLGSEFLKVCLVKPGRTPISIVVNEMSKRKSPALVGLVEDERVVSEEAFSFAIRYPNTIYSQLRNLLGRSAQDAEVQRVLQDNMLLYKVVDHPLRGTCAVQANETTSYLVEELVVSEGYSWQLVAWQLMGLGVQVPRLSGGQDKSLAHSSRLSAALQPSPWLTCAEA